MGRDTTNLYLAVQSAERSTHARVGLFEAAAVIAHQQAMELARTDAHAALDAWMDAIEAQRRGLADEFRRMVR
jgi:hypothetical protein